jgi:hypothetical protein
MKMAYIVHRLSVRYASVRKYTTELCMSIGVLQHVVRMDRTLLHGHAPYGAPQLQLQHLLQFMAHDPGLVRLCMSCQVYCVLSVCSQH